MHRKMQRRWRMDSDTFKRLTPQILALVLFISTTSATSPTSSSLNSNEANVNIPGIVNHILLDCDTPNCRTAHVSVSSTGQQKKAPVYSKQAGSSSQANYNYNSHPDTKWLKVQPGVLNNQQNFAPSSQNFQNFQNPQAYQTPSAYHQQTYQRNPVPAFTPIQQHISYLNNLTVSSLEPQVSASSHQNYYSAGGGVENDHDGSSYFNAINQVQLTGTPSYYDKTVSYYKPDGQLGDAVTQESENSQSYYDGAVAKLEEQFPNFEDIFDTMAVHDETHVDTNGIKVAVALVALWYLILAVLLQGNFLSGSKSECDGGGHGGLGPDFPLWEITAEPDHLPFTPHDPALQKEVYDMFGSSDDDSSIEVPDMSHVSNMCSRNAFFYGTNRNHMMAVQMVMDMLMSMPGPHEMMTMAKGMLRSPDMNPKVWYEGLMRAHHERSDMSGMIMPGPLDAMPDNFIPGHAFNGARSLRIGHRSLARSHKKKKEQKCVRVDGSVGKDNGLENALWYFREDVMVNSHHWYWHLSYPLMNRVRKDRQGELFFFAHRSMLMRYNIERMSNGLDLAEPLTPHQGAVIPEGYNVHLDEINSGLSWTDRPRGTEITDIRHEENRRAPATILVSRWIEVGKRLVKSIKSGYFISRKGRVSSKGFDGIDILGNTLEATDRSINPDYYDESGYHNQGHQLIGNIVDPYYEQRLPPGPMAEPATAMRDPAFYTWHTHVDNIFNKYKRTLKPYQPVGGEFPLLWDGVVVNEVKVISKGKVNDLFTFFGKRKFELSLGLALLNNETDHDEDHLKVCTKHLDHEEFEYQIHVDRKPCAKSHTNAATVRIFIAPSHDNHGRRLTMKEQRRLFVHLDMFTTKLSVGRNIITRRSTDSSLTIPWTKSLEQLKSELGGPSLTPHCGCGWPHHLLLPRGNPHGMAFDIFAMVTNGDEDMVMDHESSPIQGCKPAPIYCGINGKRYPDARPMGYPFDRELYQIVKGCPQSGIWGKVCSAFAFGGGRPPLYLEEYIGGVTNMGSAKVLITHKGKD